MMPVQPKIKRRNKNKWLKYKQVRPKLTHPSKRVEIHQKQQALSRSSYLTFSMINKNNSKVLAISRRYGMVMTKTRTMKWTIKRTTRSS